MNEDTPPMCFVHGDADDWAAMNSVKVWELLRRKGIQCDLHTLAMRGHCPNFEGTVPDGFVNVYLQVEWRRPRFAIMEAL